MSGPTTETEPNAYTDPKSHGWDKELNVPWFPRKVRDLDAFADKVLEFGAELDADHPGFKDPEYRRRRLEIVDKAKKHKHGQPLPRIDYLPEEHATWRTVYTTLTKFYKTHACSQHLRAFAKLEASGVYSPDTVPQLEEVSSFLHDETGWTLRPVMGLLTSRDFLNAFAFRVFHSTQYLRHHSKPMYTPEPDVCHELLGHVPLFADPEFADFSQEIGLASLGASDEDISKLATCYWYTVEFGVCRQQGELKAYGAGLLSSFGELEYCLTGTNGTAADIPAAAPTTPAERPKYLSFDPAVTGTTPYPITFYQPLYYVAESFDQAKQQMRQFASTFNRPFHVRYNPYTASVEVLNTPEKIKKLALDVKNDSQLLSDVLAKAHITL